MLNGWRWMMWWQINWNILTYMNFGIIKGVFMSVFIPVYAMHTLTKLKIGQIMDSKLSESDADDSGYFVHKTIQAIGNVLKCLGLKSEGDKIYSSLWPNERSSKRKKIKFC